MNKEDFIETVNKSDSYTEVLENLGFSCSSGSMGNKVKDRINIDNINISHFGRKSFRRFDINEILVENSTYTNRHRLKIRLVKEKILNYECEHCKNIGTWNGKKLSLQLEHKNGISNDNRIFNLCFLCPNCHSQTETYAGKNKKNIVP